MKKHFLAALAIFLFVSANIVAQTVFVSKTGQFYHKGNCTKPGTRSTRLPLGEAIQLGYTPCSTCKPPRTVSKTVPKKKKPKPKPKPAAPPPPKPAPAPAHK